MEGANPVAVSAAMLDNRCIRYPRYRTNTAVDQGEGESEDQDEHEAERAAKYTIVSSIN